MKFCGILGALLLGAGTVVGSEVYFSENFDDPGVLKKWSLVPGMSHEPAGGRNGSGAVKFRYDKAQSRMATLPMDIERARGRIIQISGWIKAENVSDPGRAYLGPKLMMYLKNSYEERWIDPGKKYGSYDWEKFTCFMRLPDKIDLLTLTIGLQGSSGTIWLDDIEIVYAPGPGAFDPAFTAQNVLAKEPKFRGMMSGRDLSEGAFKTLRDWNVNLIRYQILNFDSKHDLSTPDRYRAWLAGELDRLAGTLELADRYGVKLLLDLHTGPCMEQDALSRNMLSWDPISQDLLVETWETISARFNGHAAVYGYDILNEPREENYVYSEDAALDWNRLAERVALAIRRVDKTTPIVIEPAQWGSPAGLGVFQPVNVDNVIYSVHYYSPGDFTHQGVQRRKDGGQVHYPSATWDRAKTLATLQPVIDFQKKYNVPIFVGEFSVSRWAPPEDAARWLRDVIEIFEENGWDWTYHAFREASVWSLEHDAKGESADNPRKATVLEFLKKNQLEPKEVSR